MILPEYLALDLRIVWGTAAGDASARAGHYYAGPGIWSGNASIGPA